MSLIGIAVFALPSELWPCAGLGIREYLGPTQAIAIPLTATCVPVGQSPQPRTQAFIDAQAERFHLRLQSIRVCRGTGALTQSEPDFANRSFSAAVRDRWLPVYIGCCTYAFRRHFAIVMDEQSPEGPTVVTVTLIQSRWDYIKWLRSHCDQKLKAWL